MGRTKSNDDNYCCSFYQVQVLVPVMGHVAATPKLLPEGTVCQADSDNLYIGGRYKLAWKKIVQCSLEEDSFHLSDENGLHVTARVSGDARFPPTWSPFAKVLEKRWNKVQRRRAEKEAAVKDVEKKPKPIKRTYQQQSKKRSRASDFLAKNLQNLKDWDSDDDVVFNRQPPKERRRIQQEHQQEKEDDEATQLERNSSDHDNAVESDDNTTKQALEVEVEIEMEHPNHDTRQNIDNKAKTRKLRRKRRLNDESDDENLFEEAPVMTTPMAQRVVTPGTDLRRRVLHDDYNEDESDNDGNEKELNFETEHETESFPIQPPRKRHAPSIASFFAPRETRTTKRQDTTKIGQDDQETKETEANTTKAKPLPRNFFAPKKEVIVPVKHCPEKSSDDAVDIPKKNSVELIDFFAPRRVTGASKYTKKTIPLDDNKDNNASDSQDGKDPVLAPLPKDVGRQDSEEHSSPRQEEANNPKTVCSGASEGTKMASSVSIDITKESIKSLEQDDDPISDFDDEPSAKKSESTFKSPLASRLMPGQQRRLFPRKGFYGSKPPSKCTIATRALVLAGHQSPSHDAYASMDLSSPSGNSSPKAKSPLSPIREEIHSPIKPAESSISSPKKETICKWRGLRNLGNTCYINASLQMLFSIPTFADALEPFRRGNHLLSAFYQTYQSLRSSKEEGAATARALKSAIDAKSDRFRGFQQRDAHEFLGELLDKFHDELEDSNRDEEKKDDQISSKSATLPTDEFFRLNVEVCLKCNTCGYSRTKEEMYRYLSVDIDMVEKDSTFIQDKVTVERCLTKFFHPEDRELKCEKCKEGVSATQTMRVLSKPRTLLIHLKRFKVVEQPISRDAKEDENNDRLPRTEITFQKNRAPVELTRTISLDTFSTSDEKSSNALSSQYVLQSIVHHIGNTADSGHYTADGVRYADAALDNQGDRQSPPIEACPTWVSFDDGITTETTSEQVLRSVENQCSAYMLLYCAT